MEPFFATIALYDVQNGCKLSEDVWIDVNPNAVWRMVRSNEFDNESPTTMSSLGHITSSLSLCSPKHVLFRIPTDCNPENLFFYVKIEKVLQGSISQSFDVYGRVGVDQEHKSVQKYLKQVHMFCQKFGSKFRTPFCWAAIPFPQALIQSEQNELSLPSNNSSFRATAPLLRIDQSKISAEFVKRNLQDAKFYIDRPEKFSSRFTIIPDANIVFDFKDIACGLPLGMQVVNPCLVQLKKEVFISSLERDDASQKINEVDPYSLAKEAFIFSPFHFLSDEPCNEYCNILYLNQISLKFDCQKMFAKARNIACCIKVLADDSCQSPPLSVIYSPVLGHSQIFTNQYFTSLSHHNSTPDFQDEVKIELPTRLTDKHHLLFCFYHVSCDQISKLTTGSSTVGKKAGASMSAVESNVGYCWISLSTLLEKGEFCAANGTLEASHSLPVAGSVATGYLTAGGTSQAAPSQSERVKDSESGSPEKSGSSMVILNEKLEKIKFVDGGKNIFSFTSRIRSSVLPHSKFLRNLFEASAVSITKCSGRISRVSLESGTSQSVDETSSCPKVSVGSAGTVETVLSQHIKVC